MSEHLHMTPIGDTGMYVLETASWRIMRPVMDKSKCKECGMCLTYCPVNAIIGTVNKTYSITYDYCKGCGICVTECPHHALSMELEGEKLNNEK